MATQMQINYFNAMEAARHNRVSEDISMKDYKEKYRHNVVTESFNYDQLKENVRHNYQTERLTQLGETVKAGTLAESQRHNIATESLESNKIGESVRHNLAQESISRGNLELGYSNLGLGYANLGYQYASLEELTRHNVQSEDISRQEAAASMKQAEVAQGRLDQQITEENRRYGMDLIYGGFETGTKGLANLVPFAKFRLGR